MLVLYQSGSASSEKYRGSWPTSGSRVATGVIIHRNPFVIVPDLVGGGVLADVPAAPPTRLVTGERPTPASRYAASHAVPHVRVTARSNSSGAPPSEIVPCAPEPCHQP